MIISINNYFIVINRLRNINFYEVSKIFAFCIEKNRRDVNMKKILYQIPQQERTFPLRSNRN
jgi:hypothetical protein